MASPEAHRTFYAELITSSVGMPRSRLTSAFMATPREHYLGPGPWKVFTVRGYIQTPSDDPAFLYQDIVVALDEERRINNGQPMLHAVCLAALNVMEGETIVHIGVGSGYYTAVLAELAGPTGEVFAYEIDPALSERATRCLADLPNVAVHQRSGAEALLPDCDAIYVSAGSTAPLQSWLDALRPNGRLLFPLTPDGAGEMPGLGGMLLITRATEEQFDARFISPAMFIPCIGARDGETAARLAEAFKRGDSGRVRSLKLKTSPDETSWCSGNGWWFSTSENR
jgi:protein-L-isoaspartate(D-aspartate) O-methyltransferase